MKRTVSFFILLAMALGVLFLFTSCVYDCTVCRDTQKVTCSDCNGKKHFQCHQCDGKGTALCGKCNGTGSRYCTLCGGTGFKLEYDFVSKTHQYRNCAFCNSGKISCSKTISCACGNGKLDCETCGARGKVSCPSCSPDTD